MLSNWSVQGVGMTSERTRQRMIQRLMAQGIDHTPLLDAMRQVPRHWFVDEALAHRAYEDTALPIGHGQTLSQPYIVARMTALALQHATRLERALEIGTGSGYQTAVLAPFVGQLYTTERIRPLQEKARQRLRRLSIHNVVFSFSDGGLGLAKHAPYDIVLSTAAPVQVPEHLKQQLAPGGVLVIPVGDDQQSLVVITRAEEAAAAEQWRESVIEPVKFVPLLAGVIR